MANEKRVGTINNYYGGLYVGFKDDKTIGLYKGSDHILSDDIKGMDDGTYYWYILDIMGREYQEIPKSLYDELVKFQSIQND